MNSDLLERQKIVNEWLRFAETKNAALVALNTGGIFGILNTFKTTENLIFLKGFITVLFCISLMIALFSFLPTVKRIMHYKPWDDETFIKKIDDFNSVFWGQFSQLSVRQAQKLIEYKDGTIKLNKADLDILDQIIQNSKIAQAKFNFFTIAGWLTIIAINLGIVSLFCINFLG